MDRSSLEVLLAQRLSLAEIGRRFGRHEATVAYWIRKYGLAAVNHEKHVAKGALSREELLSLVEAGMSSSEIAESLGRSKSTVRHWLREYGLQTQWAQRRQASSERHATLMLVCTRHGVTQFRRRTTGGYRCSRCRTEAVTRRRRKIKQILVAETGGACTLCGYDRCIAALEFHHVVPAEKRFSLSHRGVTRSIARARQEASKCVLLCANCHAEAEAGLITVEERGGAYVQCDARPESSPG
jgi:transposase